MKRNPRKIRWTKAFRKAAGKEMTIDSTFEFEKKRNIPVRYDREKMETTVKAIKRVQEIKSKRERQFYINRMASKKDTQLEKSAKEIEKQIHLIETPALEAKAKLAKHASKVNALKQQAKMELA